MTDKQIIKLNKLTEISQELGLYEQCPYMGDDKRCKAHLNEVFWWKCYEFDNCLYKKYKAKEQECETLASQLDFEVQKKECLEQECEELKDKLNCCFCNPYVELNDTEKQQKCVEVTECFRRQLDQLKGKLNKLRSRILCENEDDLLYELMKIIEE